MALIAQFDSICARCKQPIKSGDKIYWRKKNTARHTNCPGFPRKWQEQGVKRP